MYTSCLHSSLSLFCTLFFFFNDTATTEIYTLSLHDALPISSAISTLSGLWGVLVTDLFQFVIKMGMVIVNWKDRKSTRLNSSHGYISYAVFCLKKKKKLDPQGGTAGKPRPKSKSGLFVYYTT